MGFFFRDNPVAPYRDRRDAGQRLVPLIQESGLRDPVVLALPRGGVPVAWEIARALGAPLDVLVVRKLGLPGQRELAMGAVASGGISLLNESILRCFRVPPPVIQAVLQNETAELERREHLYRGQRPPLVVEGRSVILVDDGMATGASMAVAVEALRARNPACVLVAVPVAANEAAERVRGRVDAFCCPLVVEDLGAVGQWYGDFSPTTDREVAGLLGQEG